MQILSNLKQLLFQPVIIEFELEKEYHKGTHLDGKLYIQANRHVHIATRTINVVQTIHISKKETETTVFGTKTRKKPLDLDRLQKHEVAFQIPVKFPKVTKREHKTYKGDLGPMNKATDQAKRQMYTYTIEVILKLRGKKETITHTEELRVAT